MQNNNFPEQLHDQPAGPLPEVNIPYPEARPVVETPAPAPTAEKEAAKEFAPTNPPEVRPATEQAAPTKRPRPSLWQVLKKLPPARDEVTVKIEKIMEEGLAESYQKLSPVAQQEFKLKGEETASKIRELMQATKVKFKKIFKLIYKWLKLLPGINRFFLEQEAKIKAEKITTINKLP